MEITEVKIFLVEEPKLKAFVSVVLDRCFMINDIKVIKGRDGLFVSMPSRRKKSGEFKDIAHPLNNDTRALFEKRILTAYQTKVLEEGGASETEPVRPLSTPHSREAPPSGSTAGAPAEPSAAEDRLDEVQRRHLSDSFWSVG